MASAGDDPSTLKSPAGATCPLVLLTATCPLVLLTATCPLVLLVLPGWLLIVLLERTALTERRAGMYGLVLGAELVELRDLVVCRRFQERYRHESAEDQQK